MEKRNLIGIIAGAVMIIGSLIFLRGTNYFFSFKEWGAKRKRRAFFGICQGFS